jgi:hypothetical protein
MIDAASAAVANQESQASEKQQRAGCRPGSAIRLADLPGEAAVPLGAARLLSAWHCASGLGGASERRPPRVQSCGQRRDATIDVIQMSPKGLVAFVRSIWRKGSSARARACSRSGFVSSDGREAGREPDCAQLLVSGLPRVDLVEVVHPDG